MVRSRVRFVILGALEKSGKNYDAIKISIRKGKMINKRTGVDRNRTAINSLNFSTNSIEKSDRERRSIIQRSAYVNVDRVTTIKLRRAYSPVKST